MKNYNVYILISVLIISNSPLNAQTINWGSLKEENTHIINAGIGVEYGFIYGLGYSYQIKSKLFPIVVNLEYSFPSGNKIFDDFKTKIGGQIRWIDFHDLQFSTKIHGVFRRYANDFVQMANFGSDMSGIIGYYRSKWFVAGEVGFDKAIVTHFKFSEAYKDQYSGGVNGWYEPATGGNFYYGLQAGFSFLKQDIWFRLGKIITQDFKTSPMIPLYGQLGYNLKF